MNTPLNSTLGFLMAVLLIVPGQSQATKARDSKKAKVRVVSVVDGEELVVEQELDLNQQYNHPLDVVNNNANVWIGEGSELTIYSGPDGSNAVSVHIGPDMLTVTTDEDALVIDDAVALPDPTDSDVLDAHLLEQVDALELNDQHKHTVKAVLGRNNLSLDGPTNQRHIVWEEGSDDAVNELMYELDLASEDAGCLVYKAVVVKEEPAADETEITETPQRIDARPLKVKSFEVYPNPSADVVYVALETKSPLSLELLLSDANGKVLQTQKLYGQPVYDAVFDVAGLPAGEYRVTVRQGKKTLTRKLLRA